MPLNEIRKAHHKDYRNNRSNKPDDLFENSYDIKKEIIGQVSTTKDRKSKSTQKKLENQIIDAKKSHHQKYQKSTVRKNNSNKDTHNNSYIDADTDNIASPNK